MVEEKQQKLIARILQFHEMADTMIEGIKVDTNIKHIDNVRFCARDMEEEKREAVDLKVTSEKTDEEVTAKAMHI